MRRMIAMAMALITLLSSVINVTADNSTTSVLVNTEINFEVDGEKFVPRETDGTRVYPLTYNDRTYIPARFIAEKIGLEVTWDSKTQTVGFITKDITVSATVSEKQETIPQKFNDSAIINQKIRFEFDGAEFIPKETDGTRVYPLTYKDRTYIPARFIAEEAGVTVTWDGKTQTVGFKTKDDASQSGGQITETPKPVQTEKEEPEQTTPVATAKPEVSDEYAKEYKALRDKIESMRVQYMGDNSWYGSTQQTIEKRLSLIPYLGVETVNYPEIVDRIKLNAKYNNNSYQAYKDSAQYYLPSYADLYVYYMKNNTNKTDREILDHLNEVYSLDINEATTLIPVNQSDVFRRWRMGLPVEPTSDTYEGYADIGITSTFADIPGNGRSFHFQHMGWGGEFLRTEYFVGQNDALVSREIFTKFSVKLNPLMANYKTYLGYYVTQKVHPHDRHSGIFTDRLTQINQYALLPFTVLFDDDKSEIFYEVSMLPDFIKYFNDATETNLTHWDRFNHENKSAKEQVHTICWPDLQ